MYEHKMRKVNQNLQDYSQMVLLTSISNLILKQTEKKKELGVFQSFQTK